MIAVTAVRIFMFTLTFYCVLVMNDTFLTSEENPHVFRPWITVSLANASIFKDELALEAGESVRALRRAIKPIGLERHLKAVRYRVTSRVTSRVTLFSSFATAQLSLDTAFTTKSSGNWGETEKAPEVR